MIIFLYLLFKAIGGFSGNGKIYFVLILDIILELSYQEQMYHVLHYVDPNADEMKVMES